MFQVQLGGSMVPTCFFLFLFPFFLGIMGIEVSTVKREVAWHISWTHMKKRAIMRRSSVPRLTRSLHLHPYGEREEYTASVVAVAPPATRLQELLRPSNLASKWHLHSQIHPQAGILFFSFLIFFYQTVLLLASICSWLVLIYHTWCFLRWPSGSYLLESKVILGTTWILIERWLPVRMW